MIEVKIIRGKTGSKEQITVLEKAIQRSLNDGWELRTFTESGQYGYRHSVLFTRVTSEKRITEDQE